MAIQRTKRMVDAALVAYDHTDGHREAIGAAVQAVIDLIDEDYVPRWGTLVMSLGMDYLGLLNQPSFMKYMKEAAEDQAKYMGGTIEFDKYEIIPDGFLRYSAKWRLRRND